jgi:hypothetical protein
MSKAQAAGRQGDAKVTEVVEDVPALKPRRGLFIALMLALVVWVGFLLVLYFTTVLPREKERLKQPTTSASATHRVGKLLLRA